MMNPTELSAYIREHFTQSAYRWERQPAYEVASDGSNYRRHLDGLEPDWSVFRPWLDHLVAERAHHAAAGTPGRYRVRLYHDPITDYEVYESEVYVRTAAAGEGIFVIDPAEMDLPPEVMEHDYWLLDDEHAVRMHYGPDGTFHGGTVEPKLLADYRRCRDLAMAAAAEFDTWWAAHPEHHRDHRRAA